jgi:hypothetical protein
MDELAARIFDLSEDVRYVAFGRGQDVSLHQREGIADASSSDTDRFEELLVNPTLLKLATQRGNIDCGGLRYLIVGYGNFLQLVLPHGHGHVSVAFEPHADPAAFVELIEERVRG